jgi:chitodextrinase
VPGPVAGAPLSTAQIRLAWGRSTDNVVVVGYRIFRNGMQIAQVSTTTYTDSGLQPGTTYSYAVAAVDNSGNVSARSAAANIATTPRDTQAPSVPTGLSALAGRDVVYLSWTPSSDNVAVATYQVFRNNVKIAVSSVPGYQDTTVKGSTTYTYKVLAADANGNLSGFSEPKTVTTPDTVAPTVPGTPAGEALSTTQIKLSWPAATDNVKIAGYRIFRNGSLVGNSLLTQYVNSGLTPSTTYSYTVVAVDTMGNESAPSAACSVTTQGSDTQAPSTPTIQSATPLSATQIVLRWTASSDNKGVAGYYIYRDGTKVGAAAGTAWMNSALTPATTYSYTVVAVDAAGNTSAPSAPVSGTTMTPPDRTPPSVPSAVQATAIASNRVSVTWTESTDNVRVTGYKVFRNGTLIAIPASPPFVDGPLHTNTTYTYTVAAYDSGGNTSAQSAGSAAKTAP